MFHKMRNVWCWISLKSVSCNRRLSLQCCIIRAVKQYFHIMIYVGKICSLLQLIIAWFSQTLICYAMHISLVRRPISTSSCSPEMGNQWKPAFIPTWLRQDEHVFYFKLWCIPLYTAIIVWLGILILVQYVNPAWFKMEITWNWPDWYA